MLGMDRIWILSTIYGNCLTQKFCRRKEWNGMELKLCKTFPRMTSTIKIRAKTTPGISPFHILPGIHDPLAVGSPKKYLSGPQSVMR